MNRATRGLPPSLTDFTTTVIETAVLDIFGLETVATVLVE